MKRKSVLFIDTSSNQVVEVGLSIGEKKEVIKKQLDRQKAQVVLFMIEELLSKNGLTYSQLTGIEVHLGPGSFTGLRVGASIANTLGTYLRIPVNGNPVGKIVEPVYS